MVQVIPQSPGWGAKLGEGLGKGIASGMDTLAKEWQTDKERKKFSEYMEKLPKDASIEDRLLYMSQAPVDNQLKTSMMSNMVALDKQEGQQKQNEELMNMLIKGPGESPDETIVKNSEQEEVSEDTLSKPKPKDDLSKKLWTKDQITSATLKNPNVGKMMQEQNKGVEKEDIEKRKENFAEKKLVLQDNKKYREKITSSAEASRLQFKSIKNQQYLIDQGLETGQLTFDNMMTKLGLGGAASPEAQAFQANTLNYMEGQKDKFGVRLSDADLSLIMDKLPSIARSVDGNKLILSLFESEARYNSAKKDSLQEAMKGDVSWDFEENVDKILEQKLAEDPTIEGGFKDIVESLHRKAAGTSLEAPKSKTFESMPSPVGNENKILTDDKTGKRWKSNGKAWKEI